MTQENEPSLYDIHALLARVDERTAKMDDRYAKKWVEKAVVGVAGVFGTVIAIVATRWFQGS